MTSLRFFLIGFLLLSSVCDVALACYALRRSNLPGATAFAALMAAVGCYSFGYAGELSSNTLEAMLTWSCVQYMGIVLIAPLWIIITLHYSGRGHWLRAPLTAGLFVIPCIILILRIVPDFSRFIYRLSWIATSAPFPMLSFSPGPWYWVSVGYTNLALLSGTFFIGVKPWHNSLVYRRQDLVMLLGSLFPWFAFLLYLLGLNPWEIDLVPIALSLAGPLYAWGILSFRLFDLAPVARETLFDRMREPVLVFDGLERFVDCNRAAALFALEGCVGFPVARALAHLPGLSALLVYTDDREDGPLWQDCRDGRFWQVSVSRISQGEDTDRGRLVVLRDVTGLKRVEEAIRKLSTIVEQSPVSIVITDREGIIEYVNPSFLVQTGYTSEEVLGKNPRILKGGDQPAEFYAELWRCIQDGDVWRGEFHNRKKNGDLFWESASISPIRNSRGEITHFAAIKEDITEKKRLIEQLQERAHHDALTGLPNRTLFFDRLNQAMARATRDRYYFGLLYLDLDGFKEINDTHGHEAGDHVLRGVADRLTSCLRGADTVARMGGDEFTIILATLSQRKDAGQVTEHILDVLSRPFILPDGCSVRLGVSIGISVFPDDADDAVNLLNRADAAMYKAKRSGKNTYCFGERETLTI
jgi:diguanylate cyclase (GGDEF)-like protein/PAS domain S-box-containing protein